MVNVVFSLNRCIAKPLLVTINSILTNSLCPEDIRFHIVVPPGDRPFFTNLIKQAFGNAKPTFVVREFIPPPLLKTYLDKKFKERKPERVVSRYMQYARLFLKSIFPEISRVIYLDVDLIVFHDIQELYSFSTPFDAEHFLAAVPQNFPCLMYFSNSFKIWDEGHLD